MNVLYIIIITIIYFFVSTYWINWDHLHLLDAKGLDPDSGSIAEALGYLYNLRENWNIGYKTYSQGYGILLAVFYKILLLASTVFGDAGQYSVHFWDKYNWGMKTAKADIISFEGRLFFLYAAARFS